MRFTEFTIATVNPLDLAEEIKRLFVAHGRVDCPEFFDTRHAIRCARFVTWRDSTPLLAAPLTTTGDAVRGAVQQWGITDMACDATPRARHACGHVATLSRARDRDARARWTPGWSAASRHGRCRHEAV